MHHARAEGKAKSPRSSGKCASYPPPSDHGAYSTPFVGIAYETASFVVTLASLHPCAISSGETTTGTTGVPPVERGRIGDMIPAGGLFVFLPEKSVQTAITTKMPTRSCVKTGLTCFDSFRMATSDRNAQTAREANTDRPIHISPLLNAITERGIPFLVRAPGSEYHEKLLQAKRDYEDGRKNFHYHDLIEVEDEKPVKTRTRGTVRRRSRRVA